MLKRLTFLLVLICQISWANLLRPGFEGVRPTGMGDAFIALADDANALFYNPAGLTQVKKVSFHLLDTTLGADNTDTLNRINKAVFKGDVGRLVRTDQQFLRFGIRPTFIAPGIAFAVYEDVQGFFNIKDILTKGLEIYAHNDLGAALGVGIPVGNGLSVGATVKVFERSGVDFARTPTQILSDPELQNAILAGETYNVLKNRLNTGWAAALTGGILWDIPTHGGKDGPKFRLAAVAEDIGNTSFKKFGSGSLPGPIRQSYHFGGSISQSLSPSVVWNTTVDYKHALESIPFVKQLHAGTEIRHKYFGVRGGLSQGYLTGGVSLEFPPHTRIHFSTYAVELGENWNETEHRWYLLQFVIGFNPL